MVRGRQVWGGGHSSRGINEEGLWETRGLPSGSGCVAGPAAGKGFAGDFILEQRAVMLSIKQLSTQVCRGGATRPKLGEDVAWGCVGSEQTGPAWGV